MQFLPSDIISQARKEKMRELSKAMKEFIKGSSIGEIVICPECQYVGQKKNKRGSAKIFKDSIKCFNCGLWRKI